MYVVCLCEQTATSQAEWNQVYVYLRTILEEIFSRISLKIFPLMVCYNTTLMNVWKTSCYYPYILYANISFRIFTSSLFWRFLLTFSISVLLRFFFVYYLFLNFLFVSFLFFAFEYLNDDFLLNIWFWYIAMFGVCLWAIFILSYAISWCTTP